MLDFDDLAPLNGPSVIGRQRTFVPIFILSGEMKNDGILRI
jgi:hypothetical protein